MNPIRSAGYDGSTGRYAPPAFHTASNATTRSTDRSNITPTTDSAPTPRSVSTPANRDARSSNSSYVTRWSPHTTATASGVRATCAANNSDNVNPGTARAVSFHPSSNRSRTSSGSTPTCRNRVPAGSSNASTRPATAASTNPHSNSGSPGATASALSPNPDPKSSTDTVTG